MNEVFLECLSRIVMTGNDCTDVRLFLTCSLRK